MNGGVSERAEEPRCGSFGGTNGFCTSRTQFRNSCPSRALSSQSSSAYLLGGARPERSRRNAPAPA